MTRILILIITLTTAITSWGEVTYDELSTKATRFFNQKEWASASAMYQLMLDREPRVVDTYAHAIVAEGMRNATAFQQQLLLKAVDHALPFDSVFSGVRDVSYSLGNAAIYERFLSEARTTLPWARRTIDAHLLKYFLTRGNGQKVVELSSSLLEGWPDNESFLLYLAKGYMLTDNLVAAEETLNKALEVNANNVEALLNLGNLLLAMGREEEALPLLERAYALNPTPHLEATIRACLKMKLKIGHS